MSQRQIKVEITEKNQNGNYAPTGVLYIGRLIVAEYGYDYCSLMNIGKFYAKSPFHFRREKLLFETESEAKDFAYELANNIIDLIIVHDEKEDVAE